MPDTRFNSDTPKKRVLTFSRKLILGITSLLILGLVVMLGIVGTAIHGVIHDSVVAVTQRNTTRHAGKMDARFSDGAMFVEHLAITWQTTGIERGDGFFGVDPVAQSFVERHLHLAEIYVGFEDGGFVSGGWRPEADWDPRTRPWYVAGIAAAQGETVTVLPFVSSLTDILVSSVAKRVPDLGGTEAVVAVGIRLDAILEVIKGYDVAGGGYLVLVGPNGEIIFHPDIGYVPPPDGPENLRNLPNGERLMEFIGNGGGIASFDDAKLGPSYFMAFPLEAARWTLLAVVPTAAVQGPVLQNMVLIMVTLAVFLLALFVTTIFFVSRLTRSMVESQVAEERLQIIFDNMPLVSNFRNREYGIMTCNAEAPKLFGLRDKQEYLDRFFELSPKFQPDGALSAEAAETYINWAFETGKARFEWMHQKLDGEPIPTEVTLIRVNFRDGDHVLAFVRDLREFYEAKKQERMLMQRMQAILESSPLMCFIFDENCNVLEVNREAERLLGIPDKRMFMDDYFAFSPERQPDGAPSREKALAEVRKTLEDGSNRYEWVYRHTDGTPIPAEEILERVNLEGRNVVVAYTRDLRDVQKYREAEDAAKRRLQLMLDSSPLICALFDEDVNVVEANNEVVSLFGLSDKREYVDRFFDLVPEFQPDGTPSREKALKEFGKAFETGEARLEWMHQKFDGTPIPTEVHLKHVKVEERNLIIAHARDLRDSYKHLETTKRMQFIFDSVPLVLSFWDKDFRIVECNEEAARRFGLSNKREFMERFFEFSPEFQPDGSPSMEMAVELMREGFSKGHSVFEWMHIKPDGTEVPSEISCFRTEYMGQDMLLVCNRDVREIKEAQQRELEISNRIQLMFNSTPLVIAYWDRDFNCIECNKTAFETFGFTNKDMYIKNLRKSMPEFQPNGKPSWEHWTQNLTKIFDEGYARFDFSKKRLNDGVLYMEVLGVRMKYNNSTVVVTYSNDVTQLKQTMVRMREADERAKLMLDGTPVACYLINQDFEAIDCNNETLKLFDFKDKGNGIAKFREIVEEQRINELRRNFDNVFETGADRFEWILRKPGTGEPIPCDIALIRFSHRGEHVVAAYLFDLRVVKEMLRERERGELAEESSRAKSRFLARMSHEIRTPLTSVLGLSEIQLQNPALTPQTEEAFAKIHSSAGTLLGIVNDILDLSKIEAGKLSLVNGRYGMASLIGDVVQLHLIYVGSRKIKFRVNVDEQVPAFLIGDELRLKQILNNLLSNAFKYTDAGYVELVLRCRKDGPENRVTLVIEIGDTGMGMSPQQIEALYDEYTRFHEREKRLIGGTGLGMPIVYSLVRMMGGKLEVESEVGRGTTVAVYVPQETAGPEILGAEAARRLQRFEMSSESAARRFKFVPESMPYGRVLVVDDVDANLYVAQGLLLFYDLQIETCGSGEEAVEKIRSGKVYDIVFMDHMMPTMDGMEAVKIIRELGYTKPVVALTANALIGQAEEFMRNGFDGFISKPIQTTHLNTILTKFIRDRQPPEVLESARAANRGGGPAADSGIDGYLDRPEVANKLRADFARSQKNALADIGSALESGDVKTAHRLAHTLKGLAGTIKETDLAKAAGDLEKLLSRGEIGEAVAGQIPVLEREFAPVLARAKAAISGDAAPPAKVPDREKTKKLLDELAGALTMDSADCLGLAEELRGVPEAAVLVKLVEEFDFDTASKTLAALREVLEL